MKGLGAILALSGLGLSQAASAEIPAMPVFFANEAMTATLDRSSLKTDPDGVTLSYTVTFTRARVTEDKVRMKYQVAYVKILCAGRDYITYHYEGYYNGKLVLSAKNENAEKEEIMPQSLAEGLQAILCRNSLPVPAQELDIRLARLDIDFGFTCPEALKNDQEREKALRRFMESYKVGYPEGTVSSLLELRLRLLRENKCVKTLKNMRSGNSGTEL